MVLIVVDSILWTGMTKKLTPIEVKMTIEGEQSMYFQKFQSTFKSKEQIVVLLGN